MNRRDEIPAAKLAELEATQAEFARRKAIKAAAKEAESTARQEALKEVPSSVSRVPELRDEINKIKAFLRAK